MVVTKASLNSMGTAFFGRISQSKTESLRSGLPTGGPVQTMVTIPFGQLRGEAVDQQAWRWAGEAWHQLSTGRRRLSPTSPRILFYASGTVRAERAASAAGPHLRPVRPAERRARSDGGPPFAPVRANGVVYLMGQIRVHYRCTFLFSKSVRFTPSSEQTPFFQRENYNHTSARSDS